MIVTFLRSSSYGTHQHCSHRYMLEYVMGLKGPANKKANMGTIVHKAMEVLARQKKAEQLRESSYEDENFGHVPLSIITPEWATEKAFTYYITTPEFVDCAWSIKDYDQCYEWVDALLNYNNGMYDPRKRNIVEPEQQFDFTIDKPWAAYDYNLDGEKISGQLGLKGTMDLVVEDEPGIIEVIDWKTGKREDWAKNWKLPYSAHVKKSYQDLRYDPQLCLYHYATSRLYPKADEIFITIMFINDGGPYTLCFEKSDIELTEKIIRRKFEEIRNTVRPVLNRSWKCSKFCHFAKAKSEIEPEKSLCEFYKDEVNKNGMDETMLKWGKKKAWERYGSGGGRQETT